MKKREKLISICGLAFMLFCNGCSNASAPGTDATKKSDAVLAEKDIKEGNTEFAISCHDPQIIYADGRYYMCGSHQVIAESEDMASWKYIANGNNMFTNIFSGDMPAFAYVGQNDQGGYSIWASNIFYNETMKKYIMYFCTSSTYIKSSLCMAVSDTPGGPYIFEKAFLHSGFGENEVKDTNLEEVLGKKADISRYLEYGGYNNKAWPNCIDPAVFTDADGRQWMVYGSWSGGIFLLELDRNTGLPLHLENDETNGVDSYFGYHLAGGGHHAVEGPYISYDADSGYYYLFLSYGRLEREGGYQIREFRSKNPTGPYLDGSGKQLGDEEDYFNYGIKMVGNYKFPSLEKAYMAPGGQSVFIGADGKLYITYHQRFDGGTEYHEPRVHRLYQNADGWYVMAPFETGSEREKKDGYTQDDISGVYYLIDHGLEVGNKIREAQKCTFTEGKIVGMEETGTYQVSEGDDKIQVTIGDATYQGVLIEMDDEAGNHVRCISACSDTNHTIWAVQYRKK